jgi:hypothetical protein
LRKKRINKKNKNFEISNYSTAVKFYVDEDESEEEVSDEEGPHEVSVYYDHVKKNICKKRFNGDSTLETLYTASEIYTADEN